MSEHPLYGERAGLYDRIYHWKDSEGEAVRLANVLAGLGVPDGARILEAACGTGAFLAPLAERYEVAGFDLSPAMLEIARGKLPEVPLFEADLETFEVDEPFDAILCLFSSIGYLRDDAALRRAAVRFAAAVRPGGAVVIEPWLELEDWTPGLPFLQTYDGDDLKIARMSVSSLRGDMAVVDFQWVCTGPGGPIETFEETHELRLMPRKKVMAIFADAGIRLRESTEETSSARGLLLGKRS